MKRCLIFALLVVLVFAMAIPAYAVTPKYEFPDLPEIPDISDDIHFELPDSFWDMWFDEHPINWKPMVKIELPENFWDNIGFDFFGG